MKHISVLSLFVFVFLSLHGQDKRLFHIPETILDSASLIVTYNLQYQQDSTNSKDIREEQMLLLIGDSISVFMSKNQAFNDSLRSALTNKYYHSQNIDMYRLERRSNRLLSRFRYYIYKHHDTNSINVMDMVLTDWYNYSEPLNTMQWDLKEETEKKQEYIEGFRVTKATTNFGGRNWIAWFTPEITVSEGPYKFSGLPGLILKLQDEDEQYSFTLSAITRPIHKKPIYKYEFDNILQTNKKQFFEVNENFRQSFIIHAREAQLAPESQRIASENMRRRNNPIELKPD
ncbi:MAG: GLPGLI family protein [bacterium]